MTRTRLLVLIPVCVVLFAAPSVNAFRPTAQYGCSTAGAILVNGATPSAECTFFISCFPEGGQLGGGCAFVARLDVNGTGQVQGSLTHPQFPAVSCTGIGHCGATRESGPFGNLAATPYRCAANGLAVFVTVTCSVHMVSLS